MNEEKRRQEVLAALSMWAKIQHSPEGRALNEAWLRQLCGVIEEWCRCKPEDHLKMVALRAEATTLIAMLNHEYGLWRLVVATTPPDEENIITPPPNWLDKLLHFFKLR